MKRMLFLALPLLAACSQQGYLRPTAPALADTPTPQDDKAMYLALIERMQREGAWYASLAHVEAYRNRFGDTPALRVLQAEALRRTGRNDDAAALYRTLLKGPQAPSAWHGLGMIAAAEERAGEAEDALARAVALDPLNATWLGDLGFQRLRDGRGAQAQAPLAQAAELAPGDPRAVANLALWMLLHGDASQAEAMMRQAALPDATRSEIYRLAGDLRHARPRPQPSTATGMVQRAPAATPRDPATAPPSMLERFSRPATSSTGTVP